jgi:hypothetical protein
MGAAFQYAEDGAKDDLCISCISICAAVVIRAPCVTQITRENQTASGYPPVQQPAENLISALQPNKDVKT